MGNAAATVQDIENANQVYKCNGAHSVEFGKKASELFAKFDYDGNGNIDMNERKVFFSEVFKFAVEEASKFKNVNIDTIQVADVKKVLTCLLTTKKEEEFLHVVEKYFDRDGDGKIDLQEFDNGLSYIFFALKKAAGN